MASKMTAPELAAMLLNGRQSAWISVKQAAWLKDTLLAQGFKGEYGRYSCGGLYELYISPLNGAGCITKAEYDMTPKEPIKTEEEKAFEAKVVADFLASIRAAKGVHNA